MTILRKACMLATVGALLAPASAMAMHEGIHDVVKDARGNVVLNSFGNCVVTKWPADMDECRGGDIRARLSKENRTVYFDFNKSTLNASEKTKLDSLSEIIASSSQVESVDIVGFADMIGTSSYNRALSQRRARTVRSYLASKGLKTRNVRLEAMGEKMSVTSCDSNLPRNELIACLAADRRVEIELNIKE
ncbi:MAG: OmpA family protein [Alphaproteobacteria bacterium]